MRQTPIPLFRRGGSTWASLIAGCVYELGHRVNAIQRINHVPTSRIIADLR